MDTLSLVSQYLNDLKEYLDHGDSLEARKLTIGKCKEELELFKASEHKSVMIKEGKHRVVVFTKAPPRTYSKPFTRFSLPCDVDGQSAWDAELDMADSFDYMTEERFDKLGFVHVDYGKYERKMVKEVRVEIYGFTFIVDFVVIGYANEIEPSVIFGRDFLVTSKSEVDFGIGEICIDLTMLEEEKEFNTMLESLVEKVEEIGSFNGELVKMRKDSRNKVHNVNKLTPPPQLKIKEIPPISSIAPPPPIYHPLSQKQKENVKEALDQKYKELEESKPILEVLENYLTYKKKLDEVMMGRDRLSSDEFGKEENMRTVEHGLPKKICDPGNFVLPVRVNGTVEMSALADTRASVSVLPYSLFKNLCLSDPKPYNSNLTMAGNTQARAMMEVRNVRIQIGVIDMGCDTMSIDDGVIHFTYFPKPRAMTYLDNFELNEKDDWLSSFKVGRDKNGNPKYGPVAPSFIDIKDDMERALAMEAYFNPFKIIIVFKKLIDFLVITPSEWKFTRGFKTKKTKRKLSEKFTSEDIFKFDHFLDYGLINPNTSEKATQSSHLNPLITNYEKRNKQGTVEYYVQQVKNANLKWEELPSIERHAYCEQLSKLQEQDIHSDSDVFEDYSWERAISISGDVYLEWCLEFFSTIYFNKWVDRTKLITEKCIWFRLCRHEQVLTLPQFAVLLGLYKEDELKYRLFALHFTKLEVDDKLFNHDAYWVGSKERCQKRDLWLMSALDESHGYLVDEEVAKCSEPIESEKWTAKMLASELHENIHTLLQTTRVAPPPREARRKRQERIGLNSSWGDWNASLNENERRDVWRDSMLMRNNYMLKHSMPILHHLAYQYNFAYPTYEPPNVLPYPYPYVPYPHPYTHYPEAGSQSYGGEYYRAQGDAYYACPIIPSSGYEIRGSSGGVHGDDDDEDDMSDQYVRSENCVASDDDDDRQD
uniref:Reverse transcriptase domain-containing protein n=1 Tax=Tanacetum cinerariifolium TaxID=118510 RepID=A0A6L2NW15_TANCI|nr:hypothetical protein [Tanacetum cinerariifolium]